MVTTGVDHSVLDRSLMVLENEHAQTEDKVASCSELNGYFNHLVKNETDLLPLPFKIHGEKLIKTLLQNLEKGNGELRSQVLLVLKQAVQLLQKGLSMGMHVASQCYAMLLKTSRATEEDLEPSCKSETLVELFQCMSRFDDPQFLDAVMTMRYSDHKDLIKKSVNVCGESIDSNLNDLLDYDSLISSLRLEALCFAKRLIKVCGSLLLIQFEEDLDFWFELLLPQVFVFREVYDSVLCKEVDADTRKAAREAVKALLIMIPRDEQLKLQSWQRIKSDIKDSYSDKMVKLVGIAPDWASIWCLMLDVLGAELVRKGNNHLINKLLNVEERAFKYDSTDVRVQAFICWRHLIDKLLLFRIEVPSETVQRSVRLLVQPLQPNNAKTDIMSCEKLNTWWHLVRRLEHCIENHLKTVLVPFFLYCFGSAKTKEIPPGKKYPCLHIPCAKVLANILTNEPAAEQETFDRQMSNESVEEYIIHPCKVPLLNKPAVFLDVSEELLYSVGECVIILCGRSEVETCSQLMHSIWNSLLRHVTAVLENDEILAERVVKLIQDLLRLVQNLAEHSSSTAPALAKHCISPLLEGLVMGPYALPPAVLAAPTYYVGIAQLMTGTPALLLLEVMVSRPLLHLATSHTRYVPLLKAILDIGISHHNVLEFMQSVMKQLETGANTYCAMSSAEKASLCIVWSNIASALIKYLKDSNSVNQGNERHHDLSCFYLVLLFPFYHFYSIAYKQTMETLHVWIDLYKCFHQAALRDVPTLDVNEICETMSMKICQALGKHCPTSADQAMPLLKAVQNIVMMIPFSDICGTQQSSKRKSRSFLLPDRGRASKPTNYITNTMNLVVKVSQLFPAFERSGEWYNTVGILIMSCLETLFKNMKAASVAAAIPVVSNLSDSVLSLLQANPLQDGTAKFWDESLHRVWKCYFTFIETYLHQKSVKDFLGWMSAILEVGFRHPLQEIRNITVTFWDNVVVPAFVIDNTNVPKVLKEAREKCGKTPDTSCVVPHITASQLDDTAEPLSTVPVALFALPEETNKQNRRCQSLLQQLQHDGHILTKHQKEVFRRRKDDIPELYSSSIQPVQEDSIISESSQDTCDFAAPQRIIEPLRNSVNVSEDNEPLITPSLKVLEPPSSLRRLADYRKKMMIDLEGSLVLSPISGNNSFVSKNVPEEPVSSGMSHEIPGTHIQMKSDPPESPLSLTLVSDECEPLPLPSNTRKLNLESVAVRLPTPILAPSKDMPELQGTQLVHSQDISAKPEVAIRVSISTPPSTSVGNNIIDAPISLSLEEERTICSGVVMKSNEHGHSDAHNMLGSPVEVEEIVKLSASPLTIPTDKNVSPKMPGITSTVPGSKESLLLETTNKSDNTGLVQKVNSATKSPRRKPVVVNTENPLTNYFKPVSITLTADDDEIDSSRKGGTRTIHLSIESSNSVNIAVPIPEPNVCQQSSEAAHDPQPIVSKHTDVPEDGEVPSASIVEIPATTKENIIECETSDWRQVLSPVKVVVEKIEDFILPKTFSALETTPPLNVEHDKELPSPEVSSSSRRKTKSPLKRNAGDPKLPPFKSNSRMIQHVQTKEQCMEVMSKDKLSKSSSRHNKRKESGEMRPLKRSARIHGSKYGGSGHVIKVTMEEAIPGPEIASGDRTSPSLLPAASRRMSRSKTKRKSGNTTSKIIENNMAVPQSEFSELSTSESQHKPFFHSHGILDGVKGNRHNISKSCIPLNIKDLNECGQGKIDENDSLPVCSKEKTIGVEISKQNDDSSKTNVREVSGDTYKGSEPSDSASTEAVDVEACRESMSNSAESLILHVEMPETGQEPVSQTVSNDVTPTSTNKEVKSVKTRDQSTFSNSKLFTSNSETQADGVKFTKGNISDSNGALKLSPRKLQVTNTEVSKQDIMDSLQQVHDEMPASGVKISESGTSNSSDFVEVAVQNESVPNLETSADTGTSKDEAYNMVKEGCSKAFTPTAEGTDSHTSNESLTSIVNIDKRDVKSVLSEIKSNPCIEETSKLEVENEKEISSNEAVPELSVRCRKSTSKLKSSLALLGSDGTEMNQEKLTNISGFGCNVKMDTMLGPEGLSAERSELQVTGMEHVERNISNIQHNHSLVPTEDVCTKRRKRKVCGMGCGNDLKTVQVSLRSEASHLEQSSSDTTVIEDNLVSLLEDGREDCSTGNPEICAASTTTKETVLNVTKTTPVVTSTEAASVTAGTPSAMNILPTSVERETEPVYSCDDQATKEGISEKLNESMSNFCKEENSPVGKVVSGEKVVPKQRTRYSAVNMDKPRKLRSSTSKQMLLGSHVQVKTNRRVNNKSQISDQPKELGDQTCVEVSDVAVLSQKHITEKDSKNKLDLNTSLEFAKATSCVSECEVTLSCVEIPSATTDPEGAQTDSQKVTDSEDVIESSQDSSAALAFIVSRFPLIHKCSVSVRRINTTLEAGAKIDISQGDQKLMVLIPPDSSSPFKVCTPEKTTSNAVQEEKSEKAGIETERAHCSKLLSATRVLCGKHGPLNQLNSVKDKPDVPLETNSSKDKSVQEPVSKVIVSEFTQNIPTTRNDIPKQRYKKQKCDYNTLNVAKTDAAEPRSKQIDGILTSKECAPAVTSAGALRAKSRQCTSTMKRQVSSPVINISGPPNLRRRTSNTLKYGDNVLPVMDEVAPVTMSNASKQLFRQEFDKSKPMDTKEQSDLLRTDDSISATIRQDTLEFRCKADVSTVGKEDTSKLHLKKQINIPRPEDGISSVCKEDALKPQSRQKINKSVSKVNVSVVINEDMSEPHSKQQINISESENNVLAVHNVDTPKSQSKKQINTSLSKGNILTVDSEDTPKFRSKQQSNAPQCEESALRVYEEDTPKPEPRQQNDIYVPEDSVSTVSAEDIKKLQFSVQINASKSEDDILKTCKKNSLKSRSKQQINALVSESNVSSVCSEDISELQSKQLVNTKSGSSDSAQEKEDTQKPQSKQEINTSTSENGILMADNEHTPKRKSKQSMNASECDSSSSLMPLKENIPKPRSKRKKSEDYGLTVIKEDTLKLRAKQISIPESEVISLTDVTESRLKRRVHASRLDSAVEFDIQKFQPKQQVDILKAEGRNISVTENVASKPELNSSVCEESITICVIEDTKELRPEQTGVNKKMNRESEFKGIVDIQGTKVGLRSSSEKVLNTEKPIKDKTQHSVKPKCVSTNHCKRGRPKKAKEKDVLKLDHKTSSADDSSLTLHKIADKSLCIDNVSDITAASELKETSISKGDSKHSLPIQSRKRLADSNPVLHEVHHGKVNSSLDDHIDTESSKIKRLSEKFENVHAKSTCDYSPMSSPSRTKFSNDGDNDKTPSPPSSKSLLGSPSSLLRAFTSPLKGLELNQSHKSHHKPPSGGRAQYMVCLAAAVNDMESPQALSLVPPQKPEDARSIIVASPPSLPLSRKKLVYGMSDGDGESDASSLERPQSSTAGCETRSSARISNLGNVPCKRALKQPFGEEGTLPSKKKRVWFPDPVVSDTLLFYAHDTVESGVGHMTGRELPCSETNMLPNNRRRRRCRTSFSSDADVHDESHVSVRSSNLTGMYGCAKEVSTQSQSSPDLSSLASQGSVEEITTELLNSQDAFFPPLINCTHPIECVASRLTTHVMWTKALVVELTRKNICTIGDLSRLDEASINRLPIANPKISHAKAVLQDYMKSLEVESERSTNMKAGGASRSDSVQLEPESVSSLEACQISAEDVVKYFLSNKGSLAAVLGEASKAGQCGVRLRQEMLSVFRGAGCSSEVTEESVDTVARSGRGAVLEQSFDELPQTEVMKYLVKHNPDGLYKVVSENSALASKVSQCYLQSQLASGHLSHKDFFDRISSTGCKDALLSAMQSYLMLKMSPEEIVQKLPVESVMQYVTSKLNLIDKVDLCIEGMMSDATTEIPAGHYQKLVEAVANKVTQMEFTTICYNITMANLRSK